jgi:hypothetical protein
LGDLPKVVDPVAVIGMVVSDNDPINVSQPGNQQLFAKVRPAIHQQLLTSAFDEDRRSGAPVSRFGGIAVAPVVADPRNPG